MKNPFLRSQFGLFHVRLREKVATMNKVVGGNRGIKRVRFYKGCVIKGQNDGIAQSPQLWDKCTLKLE